LNKNSSPDHPQQLKGPFSFSAKSTVRKGRLLLWLTCFLFASKTNNSYNGDCAREFSFKMLIQE
jgi:hypothetical protein